MPSQRRFIDANDLDRAFEAGRLLTNKPFDSPLLNSRADRAIRFELSDPCSSSTKVAFSVDSFQIDPEIKSLFMFSMVKNKSHEGALCFSIPQNTSDYDLQIMLEAKLKEKGFPVDSVVTIEKTYRAEMENTPIINHIQRVIAAEPLSHMCHGPVILATSQCWYEVKNHFTHNLSDAYVCSAWLKAVEKIPPQWDGLSESLQIYFQKEGKLGSDIEEEF